MAAVSELVSGLDAELVRLGYKPSTMVWYRGCWRRLERFFASRGVEEFSLDVAMAWVDEACGFFEKEQAGTLKQTDVYLFRVAAMLDDFAVHGAVLRRYSRTVSKLTADEADVVAAVSGVAAGGWLRASTVRAYGTVAGEFLAFTGTPRRAGRAGCREHRARSSPRWPATRPRRWSTNCAPCGRFCGSPPPTGWSTRLCWRRSRRRSSSRQARVPSVWDPATWPRSWRRSTAATRAGNAITRSSC